VPSSRAARLPEQRQYQGADGGARGNSRILLWGRAPLLHHDGDGHTDGRADGGTCGSDAGQGNFAPGELREKARFWVAPPSFSSRPAGTLTSAVGGGVALAAGEVLTASVMAAFLEVAGIAGAEIGRGSSVAQLMQTPSALLQRPAAHLHAPRSGLLLVHTSPWPLQGTSLEHASLLWSTSQHSGTAGSRRLHAPSLA